MTDALCLLYTAERARLSGLSTQDNGDYMNPVFGEGPLTPNLMLIGEAPGREEAAAGYPFVGKAGRQLNELLELAGIARGDVFVTNAVKFRPIKRGARSVANRTPTAKELASGEELLKSEIIAVRPRVIATLGNSPLASMARISGVAAPKIGEAHGQAMNVNIGGNNIALFPLYHPASGIYNRELVETMRQDIVKLGQYIKEGMA
ncbi:MAG: uracil-DNA glycosylase [Eubacteriales bacterium]|nr:uracil-DNA glycosylase [Christensenellaceae bacterium]MDD7495937.1 uracil-DNA glycosylase [Christensenellaceae bacterium]MDY2748220.1 uracil-DNA glycosylase [Eubacteriales bacterium]MDY5718446.1 uracil-DNA glycosylase [Eubacteriales bacterium]